MSGMGLIGERLQAGADSGTRTGVFGQPPDEEDRKTGGGNAGQAEQPGAVEEGKGF